MPLARGVAAISARRRSGHEGHRPPARLLAKASATSTGTRNLADRVAHGKLGVSSRKELHAALSDVAVRTSPHS